MTVIKYRCRVEGPHNYPTVFSVDLSIQPLKKLPLIPLNPLELSPTNAVIIYAFATTIVTITTPVTIIAANDLKKNNYSSFQLCFTSYSVEIITWNQSNCYQYL